MKIHGYTIIIERDEDSNFCVRIPAFPECHTWGKSISEATANAKEALELCIEYYREDLHQPLPSDIAPQKTFLIQTQPA